MLVVIHRSFASVFVVCSLCGAVFLSMLVASVLFWLVSFVDSFRDDRKVRREKVFKTEIDMSDRRAACRKTARKETFWKLGPPHIKILPGTLWSLSTECETSCSYSRNNSGSYNNCYYLATKPKTRQ